MTAIATKPAWRNRIVGSGEVAPADLVPNARNWWARSKSVSTNKLVSGDVSQSAAGQPVTIVSPDGATTTVGGTNP
jgi:hypothetical protein